MILSLSSQPDEMRRIADAVPCHPLLDGKSELGRGEYSIVVDKGDGKRVFKLLSSPADYQLYTAEDRPQGVHFPRIFADYGVIGKTLKGDVFRLIEMERLFPLKNASPAAELANRLIEIYAAGCEKWSMLGRNMGRLALHRLVTCPSGLGETLSNALKALFEFVENYQVVPDLLKKDNLMMRKDGTLVLSDPVFTA